MADAATVIARLRVEGATAFNSTMAKAKASTLGVGSASTSASRGVNMFGAAMGIAAGAGGALALVNGLRASIRAAIDFESSFAGVRKTVDATEGQFAAMAMQLRGLALEVPIDVNELNRVAEAAGQLGIESANIVDFTRTMAMLGATTNLSADEAATSLARFANVMGTAQDRFGNLGNAIVALGNNFATTESEILTMGQRLAAAGRVAGLTEGQVLGIATALTSVGIQAEAGGTAFSRVFLNMNTAVTESGEQLEAFARIAGMTGREFARTFREDAGVAVNAFIQGIGEMHDSGQNLVPVLEELELNESRARSAIISASLAGEKFARAMGMGEDAMENTNALLKEAEQRFETTQAKIDIAKNSFNELGIAIGERFIPVLGDAADALIKLLGGTVAGKLAGWETAFSQFAASVEDPIERIELLNKLLAEVQAAQREAASTKGKVFRFFDPFANTSPDQAREWEAAVLALTMQIEQEEKALQEAADAAEKHASRIDDSRKALVRRVQEGRFTLADEVRTIVGEGPSGIELASGRSMQEVFDDDIKGAEDAEKAIAATRERGLSHLEDIISRTKDLYRERADAALDAYNTEVQGARDATAELLRNERENLRIALKNLDTKTGEEADALKAKIKLINDEDKRIREQERDRDRQQQRERLRGDVAAAEAEGNADRIADARQRLAEFERDLTIARAAEERAADRERLQEELQALQESARNKADALREDFETLQRNKAAELREIEKSEKAKLDAAMATIEEQRDAELQRLDDAKALLEERAKNEIEGQQALVDSLEAFGPEWKALGEHLGAEYLVGIQSMINQVQLIPPQILPLVPPNIRQQMERTTSEAQVRSQVQAAMSRESSEREAIEAASSMDTSEQREAASSVRDAGHTRESLRDDGFSDDTIDKAFGKDFAAGGITSGRGPFLVGERGPELVDLPGGSRVTPNHQLRQMAGGSVINITVPVTGPIYGFIDFQSQAVEAIKDAVDAGELRGYLPE